MSLLSRPDILTWMKRGLQVLINLPQFPPLGICLAHDQVVLTFNSLSFKSEGKKAVYSSRMSVDACLEGRILHSNLSKPCVVQSAKSIEHLSSEKQTRLYWLVLTFHSPGLSQSLRGKSK